MLILTLACAGSLWAVAKTKGTPLGGMGTGYVVYDATTGEIAASSRMPPGGGDMVCEFPAKMSSSSGFHFFAGGQSVKKAKTANEDAKCPLYTADFGKTNNVNFSLKAFGPYIPGDGELNIKLAASPLAYFEITAKNEGNAAIEVGAAFEFLNKSSNVTGLIGGADNAVIDAESGNKGISYATAKFNDVSSYPDNSGNAYLLTGCSKEGATFSAGALGSFLTTGSLANTNGNAVGAKCSIEPGESVRFKFVLSWWRTFISGQDRYKVGKNDADNFLYHNFYQNSKEAALFGMENFDKVQTAVTSMVSRVMGSNFPEWYKDRLLNNTYPLIHNSFWAKDGRATYWEGGYGIIGTIDQGQHAAIWYIYNWPKNQWNELAYWLGNMRLETDLLGQIHHDFNIAPGTTFSTAESRFMAPWDHYARDDYWWCSNTTDWSDLNCMVIFKAYELMVATGNLDSTKKYLPKILVTAQRVVNMSKAVGANIPKDSRSTYDSDHSFKFTEYSCGIAVAAYKAVEELAKFAGDTENALKYGDLFEKAKKEFKDLFFKQDFGSTCVQNWHEGYVGGYSWANYFCFPPIMDSTFITVGCNNVWRQYSQQSDPKKKVGGWPFYTYDHLGGSQTAIGQQDTALKIHKINHNLYYEDLPDLVFWQTLFSDNIGPGGYYSYMTAPNVWRSYFQFMGYLLDNANKRLWIRPRLPADLNKKIVNAPLPNPTGWGTLYYDETGNVAEKLTQKISVYYDVPVTVKELVLKNNTGSATPFVLIDNTTQRFAVNEGFTSAVEDWGIEKNIRITFTEPVTVGTAGLHVVVYSEPVGTIAPRRQSARPSLSIASTTIAAGKPIVCSIDQPGKVTIELLGLNGAKIGTLIERNVTNAGTHTFTWNGTSVNGKQIGSVVGILRLSSEGTSVSRRVVNMAR